MSEHIDNFLATAWCALKHEAFVIITIIKIKSSLYSSVMCMDVLVHVFVYLIRFGYFFCCFSGVHMYVCIYIPFPFTFSHSHFNRCYNIKTEYKLAIVLSTTIKIKINFSICLAGSVWNSTVIVINHNHDVCLLSGLFSCNPANLLFHLGWLVILKPVCIMLRVQPRL